MEQANHNHLPDKPSVENRPYSHTHTETKAVLNLLSRAIGHLESVKRMVEMGRTARMF